MFLGWELYPWKLLVVDFVFFDCHAYGQGRFETHNSGLNGVRHFILSAGMNKLPIYSFHQLLQHQGLS